jgi:predicted metal-dependent hydrolase
VLHRLAGAARARKRALPRVKWYRRRAQSYFRDRVEHFSAQLAIDPPRVFISSAQTRWGSCNANREVRLNWRLIQAPPHIVDYVVAHELAHLKEMNHSARFWRIVERLCPGYAAARTELDAMGCTHDALAGGRYQRETAAPALLERRAKLPRYFDFA